MTHIGPAKGHAGKIFNFQKFKITDVAIWKNRKSGISATNGPIRMKFGTMTEIGPPNRTDS